MIQSIVVTIYRYINKYNNYLTKQMPHISSKQLDEKLLEKLLNQFFSTIQKSSDNRTLKYVGSELFTHTEKIMFAKRLAAILLIDKGLPQHVVASELQMSISTITKISLKIEKGGYRSIRNTSGKFRGDILDQIEKLLLMGMPPRVGRGRWKSWGK